MDASKRIRDFLEPIVECAELETLGEVLGTLNQGKPVAIRWAAWHLLLPETVVGYPSSRRVIDLPLRDAPIVSPDLPVQEVLTRLVGQDVPYALVVDEEALLGVVSVSRLLEYADTTERQRAEEVLQALNTTLAQRVAERTALITLMRDVTVAANEASDIHAALQVAVDRICAYTQWPVGHAYLQTMDGTGEWVPTGIWHVDEPSRFAAFQQATQCFRPVPGVDLIGRVVVHAKPEWSDDITTDPTFGRARAAKEAGLRAGVACPLLMGKEVVGVLEFFATEARAPEASLLDILAQLGTQLGRIVERQRALDQMRRQQETLAQSEKLAAMGSLLASVAHELNNPLSIVVVEADLLREDIESGPLAEHASKITQAAARCARIVHNFLTLARQHPPERVSVHLNSIVEEALELLAYPLQVDSIDIDLQLAKDLPALLADPHQLHQVMVNLITNAHQALREMPPPRRLTLTTRADSTRRRVLLDVADTGPGIPPELLARTFEPFFTTKPPGVGTGLGLSLCRGIIEEHGGSIRVQSQQGRGAVFRIELPVEAVSTSAGEPPAPEASPPSQTHAILIVDDEAGIRSALAYLLRRDGHKVETAANGHLALAKLEECAFDLVLCDLRMPELDGPGLYRALAARQPQLCRRFIFLTGDTLSPETRMFLERAGVPRLAKPFTAAEVRRVVERAWQAV
jgi:signal transduction histidine kinase/CheY-like chemotaxis protein